MKTQVFRIDETKSVIDQLGGSWAQCECIGSGIETDSGILVCLKVQVPENCMIAYDDNSIWIRGSRENRIRASAFVAGWRWCERQENYFA